MPLYTEKDYVDVVDADGNELGRFPKKWVGTFRLPEGAKAAGKGSKASDDEPVTVPEGEPSEDWTIKQLDAYAKREGYETGSAGTKAEKVAAIEKAKAEKAGTGTTPVTGD